MDQKTQRYMQRIEQIMQSNKKGTPHRPSKSPISCKPNHLDKYLKYELAAKIITKILEANNQQLVEQFFNIIRVTEYRQKDKIYRFIAVETASPTQEVWVDATVASKVLATTLKGFVRKRYADLIQSLQACPQRAEDTPQKPKLSRGLSAKEASPVHNRMRTLTNISKVGSNFNVSEFEEYGKDKNKAKIKDFVVKGIVRVISCKNRMLCFNGFQKLHARGVQFAASMKLEENKENQQEEGQQSSLLKKHASILITVKALTKIVSSSFRKLKLWSHFKSIRNLNTRKIINKIQKVIQQDKLRAYHSLLAHIRSSQSIHHRKSEPEQEGQTHKLGKSGTPNKLKNLSESIVQSNNILTKLNFDAFVDKILKLIIVFSKLLIPLKQAFVKIDHYASYAFRIQQSLKTVPQRIMLESFMRIKQFSTVKPSLKAAAQLTSRARELQDLLYPLIKIRLIEGFTHIKIISKERDIKIKIFPAKENIIELTKKFIVDRGQYSAQSHIHWEELKSTLLSTNFKDKAKKTKSWIR